MPPARPLAFCAALSFSAMAGAAPRELRWALDVDGPVTLAAASAWITTEALKSTLAPSACRWCETNGFDVGAREGLRWSDPKTADVLSNALGFAVGPALVFGAGALAAGRDGSLRRFLVDALLVLEASVLAANASQLSKFATGRERPYAAFQSDAERLDPARSSDRQLAFFSGHTTLAASIATAAGTVASMRGYRLAPLVWIVGVPYAVAEGYLRIAADQHWLTDVIAGFATGAIIGFAVPFFAHQPVKLVPTGTGVAVGGSF